MSNGSDSAKQFEVALSFAGEERKYVEQVAQRLHERGIAVFYDRFEAEYLWGRDLVAEFNRVFERSNAIAIMFISIHYVNKAWPAHERKSILSRMVNDDQALVLPVRFDQTEVPGLPDSLAWIDGNDCSAVELAAMIMNKLGVASLSGKASDVPAPRATSLAGEVSFYYSDYNGRFVIGYGTLEFETAWSQGGDTEIYLYNDPPSINGVALVDTAGNITDEFDDASLNYTSRVRQVLIGRSAVLRNLHGHHARIKVIAIDNDKSGGDRHRLKFQYVIR